MTTQVNINIATTDFTPVFFRDEFQNSIKDTIINLLYRLNEVVKIQNYTPYNLINISVYYTSHIIIMFNLDESETRSRRFLDLAKQVLYLETDTNTNRNIEFSVTWKG
jgi:hypothetical protein